MSDAESCFRALYEHFARPDAWRVEPDAPATLRNLTERGLFLGVCSNFDRRLRGLLSGLPELSGLSRVVISSEVGWKKPAAGFFAEVARSAGLVPEHILIVGDDQDNDYPRRARGRGGLSRAAARPARESSMVPPDQRLARLSELLE